MKTAAIEDIKRDVTQLDAFIKGHESIHLLSNGQTVAVLTPVPPSYASGPIQKPDYAARLQRNFGDVVFPAGTVQALMDEERGER